MDKMEINFSTNDFLDEEINSVEDFLKEKYEVDIKYYSRHSGDPLTPFILIILFVGGQISIGFLTAIGQDIWKMVKRLPQSFRKNEGKKVSLSIMFSHNGDEINLQIATDDLEKLKSSMNSLSDISELIKEANKEGTPPTFDYKNNNWKRLPEQ